MQVKPTTQRIRDRDISVIASDIPPEMTVAQYRKRAAPAVDAPKARIRLLGAFR